MEIEIETKKLVLPGDLITDDKEYMSGKGTYHQDGCIYSSLMGHVRKFVKVINVIPLKSRYQGDTGDVVIGRVVEIVNKKWRIDIQGYDYANLHINAVRLEDIQVF